MNYNIHNWPYKWFGVWQEYGEHYSRYPGAKTFVNIEENRKYNKEKLLLYLRNGEGVVATSRHVFPSPFTGERIWGSLCYRTDGVWIWPDDLADYVEHNDLAIPCNWYKHIADNNFIIPDIIIDDTFIDKFDWPK